MQLTGRWRMLGLKQKAGSRSTTRLFWRWPRFYPVMLTWWIVYEQWHPLYSLHVLHELELV